MGSNGAYRQDMPPPGGYKQIPFERIAAKQVLKPRTIVAGIIGLTIGGFYLWKWRQGKTTKLEVEMRSARLALHPMLHAEKDRAYLIQLRKNRDEEERLMKDVPGWEVGTLYGEKIFKSRDPEEWIDVISGELFCHADPWYYRHWSNYHKWA